MEFSNIVRPVKRWWWLVVLSTLLAAVASYIAAAGQPAVYSTRATLIVGSTISTLNPTNADFQLARQLAGTYADIAQREPVREATRQSLGIDRLPAYIVSVPNNGQLIEIVVTDTNPQRAQVVANELATQLIARIPENRSSMDPDRKEFTEQQLLYLEEKITETQADIEAKQNELAELTSAAQIADAQIQLNALQGKLLTLQSNYASLLDTSSDEVVNTLSIIEEADLPLRPTNSDSWLYVGLAGLLGFTLSVSASYLLESLDHTLKSVEDVLELTDLPVMAKLPSSSQPATDGAPNGYLIADKMSPSFEAIRILRTNLEFQQLSHEGPRTILVASPGAGDGKSTVAANLAVAFAEAGKRTVLVDADLRRPNVHSILGLENSQGLTQLFTGHHAVGSVASVTSQSPNLWAIPAGAPSPNSAEILSSPRMTQVMDSLSREFEAVIIDSPPSLLADASILAYGVDGVILVVRLNHTPRGPLQASLEQLRHVNANVVGLVINDLNRSSSLGYLGYQYGYSRHGTPGENGRNQAQEFTDRERTMLDPESYRPGPEE